MENNEKTYTFRDPEHLLDNLETGNRSEFIRESVKLRIKLGKNIYHEELLHTEELIKYFTDKQRVCQENLDQIEEDRKKLQQMNRKAENELKKLLKEKSKIIFSIEQENKISRMDDLKIIRENVFKTLVKTIIRKRIDPEADAINIDFLYNRTQYITKDEFKHHTLEYVEKNIHAGDYIAKHIITPEDIQYIINNVNELI